MPRKTPGLRFDSVRQEEALDREAWNERYRSEEPNRFVAEVLGPREPAGRGLDLACGEGRIWLAKRGWSVTGVDYSEVAIDRTPLAIMPVR